MRFAVHGPGNPVASPRSHRMPCGDVPGCIHVRIAGIVAGDAGKEGLALAALPRDMPARRATLAGERGANLLHPAGCLVDQTVYQQAPARPHDLAVEPRLMSDMTAGLGGSSPRGSGHVLDIQVLDTYQVKTAHQIRAGLLGPVLAPVDLTGTEPSKSQLDPFPTRRAASGAGQLALKSSQPHALSRRQARGAQQFSSRQGRRYRHSSINSYRFAVSWCGNRFGNGGKGDVPAPSAVHCHPEGLHALRYSARPAKSNPPDLRHPNLTDLTGESPYVPLLPAPDDPEALISASLSPRRAPGRVFPVEERCHCMSKVPQRLLLHCLAAGSEPWILRPRLGELSTLLQVTGRADPAGAPVRVLFYCEVPHVPGMRAVTSQHCFLGGCGKQPVSGHANTLSTAADISEGVKRRRALDMKARVCAPPSR